MRDFCQATAPMASNDAASADVADAFGAREITDASARAIAALYASPAAADMPLTRLSQGQRVSVSSVLDSIHHQRPWATSDAESRALDMLATWAMNGPRRLDLSGLAGAHCPVARAIVPMYGEACDWCGEHHAQTHQWDPLDQHWRLREPQ